MSPVLFLEETHHEGNGVVYLGEDRNDEDAFHSLPKAITITVGVHLPRSAARFVLKEFSEIPDVLRHIRTIQSRAKAV
jgi:trehalose-6-phosphatase